MKNEKIFRRCFSCHLIIYNCCRIKKTQKKWEEKRWEKTSKSFLWRVVWIPGEIPLETNKQKSQLFLYLKRKKKICDVDQLLSNQILGFPFFSWSVLLVTCWKTWILQCFIYMNLFHLIRDFIWLGNVVHSILFHPCNQRNVTNCSFLILHFSWCYDNI